MTFYQLAKTYPPCFVRLLARKKSGRPLTSGEIANLTFEHGVRLSTFEVEAISQQADWHGVDLPTMEAFIKACGFDFCDATQMHRIRAYIGSKPTFRYLRADANWKTYYLPLLLKWAASYAHPNDIPKPVRSLALRLRKTI